MEEVFRVSEPLPYDEGPPITKVPLMSVWIGIIVELLCTVTVFWFQRSAKVSGIRTYDRHLPASFTTHGSTILLLDGLQASPRFRHDHASTSTTSKIPSHGVLLLVHAIITLPFTYAEMYWLDVRASDYLHLGTFLAVNGVNLVSPFPTQQVCILTIKF